MTQVRKTITLYCDNCGKGYDKPLSEYKRNVRLGRRCYCSLSCNRLWLNENVEVDRSNNKHEHLVNYTRADIYSPFRYHLRNARLRNKEIDLDLEFLRNLWLEQKGKCNYTGVNLHHRNKYDGSNTLGILNAASLDRIDSSKGYTKDNVQFVSMGINYAKSSAGDAEIKEFVNVIRNGVDGFDYVKSGLVNTIENLINI